MSKYNFDHIRDGNNYSNNTSPKQSAEKSKTNTSSNDFLKTINASSSSNSYKHNSNNSAFASIKNTGVNALKIIGWPTTSGKFVLFSTAVIFILIIVTANSIGVINKQKAELKTYQNQQAKSVELEEHLTHSKSLEQLLEDDYYPEAIDYYNNALQSDVYCNMTGTNILITYSTTLYSDYMSERISYDTAKDILTALSSVNDNSVHSITQDLLKSMDVLEQQSNANKHQEHLSKLRQKLNDNAYDQAVSFFNDELLDDNDCLDQSLSIIISHSSIIYTNYLKGIITYEKATEFLDTLSNINNSTIVNHLKSLNEVISFKESAETNDNNDSPAQDTSIYLETCEIVESGAYQENEGDSFVYPIGQHQFTRGKKDISGKEYQHGLEAWIARWNYTDEQSWAYSIFSIPGDFDTLTGTVVLIDSYNTTSFDSTLYFYDADTNTELKQYHLVPAEIPFEFSIQVAGVRRLKIYVSDNKATSGGTSFGLVNALLLKHDDESQISSEDQEHESANALLTQAIPEDAFEWNQHKYYVYSNASSWEEAESYCISLGGHLAVISSPEENQNIFNYIKSIGVENAYFGFSDKNNENEWRWVDDTIVDYTNWHLTNEPNSENSNEDYAMFYYKYPDGTWNDGDFGGSTANGGVKYICEWDS